MATARYNYSALDTRLSDAEQQLRLMRQQLIAQGRKAKGSAAVDAKFAAFEGELAQLRQQLAEKGASPVLAGQIASIENVIAAYETRLGAVESQVGMLNEGQASLSERVATGFNAVNDTLDEHGRRISDNEKLIIANDKATTARMDIVSGSVARAHARIDQIANGLPLWGWIVAAIAGVIAGVWWASIDFFTKVGKSLVVFPAEAWWAAWLAGLAAFAFVAAVVSLFPRKVKDSSTASAQASAQAKAPVQSPPATPPQPAPSAKAPAAAAKASASANA